MNIIFPMKVTSSFTSLKSNPYWWVVATFQQDANAHKLFQMISEQMPICYFRKNSHCCSHIAYYSKSKYQGYTIAKREHIPLTNRSAASDEGRRRARSSAEVAIEEAEESGAEGERMAHGTCRSTVAAAARRSRRRACEERRRREGKTAYGGLREQ